MDYLSLYLRRRKNIWFNLHSTCWFPIPCDISIPILWCKWYTCGWLNRFLTFYHSWRIPNPTTFTQVLIKVLTLICQDPALFCQWCGASVCSSAIICRRRISMKKGMCANLGMENSNIASSIRERHSRGGWHRRKFQNGSISMKIGY